MICPQCKTEVLLQGNLGFTPRDDKTWHLCNDKCTSLIMTGDNKIIHYEIKQHIPPYGQDPDIYLLEGWAIGEIGTDIYKLSYTKKENSPLYPNMNEGYNENREHVLHLSYFYMWDSQKELNSIIARLLNMKAFL